MCYFVGSCMFYVNCGVIRGAIDVFGWAQNALIMIVDNLLSVIHAAELILMVLRLKFFLSLWSLGKCLSVSDIGADVFAEWRVVPEYVVPLPVFLFVSCGWFVV